MAEGGAGDVYQLQRDVRRKPKENNFKAIFDCLRDLMTTPLVVPEWLLDVLLGYGDPAAAAYWSLPRKQQVEEYDFFDTFLDVSHVREAFPHAVCEGRRRRRRRGAAAAVPRHHPDRPAARLPRR